MSLSDTNRAPTPSQPAASAKPPAWIVEPRREIHVANGRSVVLRPLATADADLMAEFFANLTAQEVYYFFSLDEADARRLALDAGKDPDYRLIAAGELAGQERILGYMFLRWQESAPPTYGACLRQGIQSMGLGRIMIEHLLTSARASGVEIARLSVHPDNWRALRLYQRAGFRIVDEFVNRHQHVKQYRMEIDLRAPRPIIDAEVTIVPRGGLGVGRIAARVQQVIEEATKRRPLILDRPAHDDCKVIFVVDLGSSDERLPFPELSALRLKRIQSGEITMLDNCRLLIAGSGVDALGHAVSRYTDLVKIAGSPGQWPFIGA